MKHATLSPLKAVQTIQFQNNRLTEFGLDTCNKPFESSMPALDRIYLDNNTITFFPKPHRFTKSQADLRQINKINAVLPYIYLEQKNWKTLTIKHDDNTT